MLTLTGEWKTHANKAVANWVLARVVDDCDCQRWRLSAVAGNTIRASIFGVRGISVRRWIWEQEYGADAQDALEDPNVWASSTCGDALCLRRSHQALKLRSESQAGRPMSMLQLSRQRQIQAAGGVERKIPPGAGDAIRVAYWGDGIPLATLARQYDVTPDMVRHVTRQTSHAALLPGASVFAYAAVVHRRASGSRAGRAAACQPV